MGYPKFIMERAKALIESGKSQAETVELIRHTGYMINTSTMSRWSRKYKWVKGAAKQNNQQQNEQQ